MAAPDPTIIDGMRGLEGGTNKAAWIVDSWPGLRKRDVAEKIILLDPNAYALTALLKLARKAPATDPMIEWYEDEYPQRYATASETLSTGETAITFTDQGELFRPFDLWKSSSTGEVVMVVSVTSDVVTVIRAAGYEDTNNGTAAGEIATGDTFFYIGNAMETGYGARAILSTQAQPKYNYLEIFKEPVKITETAKATGLYGGSDLIYQRQKAAVLHQTDIERSFWLGERNKLNYDDNNTLLSTTAYLNGGVSFWIRTNSSVNTTGSISQDTFDGYLRTAFRYGSKTKMMFCSPIALSVISSWGRDKLQMFPRDKTFGIAISRYISPHGELNLVTNNLFYDLAVSGLADAYDYSRASVILDLEQLRYRFQQGRDTKLSTMIQDPDEDAQLDQYLTQCGLEFRLEKQHMEIYGWTN